MPGHLHNCFAELKTIRISEKLHLKLCQRSCEKFEKFSVSPW
jgi:hypothetical protein